MSSARTNDRIDVPVLIGVDDAGRVEAWVATRPGCVVFAYNEEPALRSIAAAVDEYDRCLSPVGFQPPTLATVEQGTNVRILERVTVAEPLVQGNTAAFFDSDNQPVTVHDIEATFEMLRRTRMQLLDVAHSIGEDRWSERPGGGQRTVVDVLHHVARGEWWYVSRIVDFPIPEDGYPKDIEPFMAWTRARVAERLLNLSPDERARTVVPKPETGERWSARKVLRRLIYHELYHTRQLRKLII